MKQTVEGYKFSPRSSDDSSEASESDQMMTREKVERIPQQKLTKLQRSKSKTKASRKARKRRRSADLREVKLTTYRFRRSHMIVVGLVTAICIVGIGVGLGIGLPKTASNSYPREVREEKPQSDSQAFEAPPVGSDNKPVSRVSSSRLGKYQHAAVNVDGAPCEKVGREILEKNGSAMDAAIASMFCLGVVNSQSMGLGGGFMMTYYDKETGVVEALDARETAPSAASVDMFHANQTLSRVGGLSVAVPSELKGYWEGHKKYGRLPWRDLVLPAAKLAEEGVKINRHKANGMRVVKDYILAEPSMREVYVNPNTGRLLEEGDVFKDLRLAKTLRRIAEEGGDVLYNGSLAEDFVKDMQAHGSIITVEDMKNYRVEWRKPAKAVLYGNMTLYAMPPPGSGLLLAYVMNILDEYQFSPERVNESPESLALTHHRIIEAFKHAYSQRTKLADPEFQPIHQLVQNLTSEEFAAETRAKIDDSKTFNDPSYYGAVFYTPNDKGTSHISVVAPDGSAVSATSTANYYFGAVFRSLSTGIVLNNEMDDFSAPNITNLYGISPSPANFIAPGKRPLSSMCPVIIINDDGSVRLVAGAAGGSKITSATAYVMIQNLWFGKDIKTAIDSPRFHHQVLPMEVGYEQDFPHEIVESLEKRGHKTMQFPGWGSVVIGITREKDGYLYANSDFRKVGDVDGF